MHTCHPSLDRLLDPSNDAVTLDTLRRAATAVGRTLRFWDWSNAQQTALRLIAAP